MAEEPTYMRNLREYVKGGFTRDHYLAVEREVYGDSDRAAAVVLGTLTEDALRMLLERKLRRDLNSKDRKQLFGFDGISGTFATKITLAYSLELIGPETRRELDLIRFLRNNFAHCDKPIDFKMDVVMAICNELRVPDWPNASPPFGSLDLAADLVTSGNRGRWRFILSCRTLSNIMMQRLINEYLMAKVPADLP
jgi:hypothetical protein